MSIATAESPSSPSSSTSSGDEFAAMIEATLVSDGDTSPEGEEDNGSEDLREEKTQAAEEDTQPRKRRRLGENEGAGDEEVFANQEGKEHMGTSKSDLFCPPHPGYMWGVCIRCGKNKAESEENETTGVSLKYIHKDFELSDNEIARLREDDLKKLLPKQKLYLVLDLDHTLLNSARFSDVSSDEESYITSTYLAGFANAESEEWDMRRSLYKLSSLQMWTKLRPFVHKFLEAASEMYEMYVYTMGERGYALRMAKLLDPTGKFFGTRVISQGDSTHRHQKDLNVVLGAESAVVILDDTEHVWPKHRANLIVVERYHFFGASCRMFNLQVQSLTQTKRDEIETEGILANMLEVLRSVHRSFFDETAQDIAEFGLNRKDVRQVLKDVRAEILKGCKLVFSRIYPTAFRGETHPLWKMAEELGAECFTSVDENVTHVVALDSGTDKSRWALQNKRFLVHPQWIEASHYLWQRQSEEQFTVGTKKIGPSSASASAESATVIPSESTESIRPGKERN